MNDHDERNEEPTESNEEERVSIWSVRPRVKNTFYALFCMLVIGIIGMENPGTCHGCSTARRLTVGSPGIK